jgi:hypothetical protein
MVEIAVKLSANLGNDAAIREPVKMTVEGLFQRLRRERPGGYL